jgi:hypothetical protein
VVTPVDREVASIENSPTVTDTVLKGGDLVGGLRWAARRWCEAVY